MEGRPQFQVEHTNSQQPDNVVVSTICLMPALHSPGFNEDGRGHLHGLAKPAPKLVDGSQLGKLNVHGVWVTRVETYVECG